MFAILIMYRYSSEQNDDEYIIAYTAEWTHWRWCTPAPDCNATCN